ncbi:FKBP-type peptidyl-prolyl cis-trans isomerase [Oceanobacter sp. 4_MG-2023]|uniref:FKBP-type peptidyl-prolyl cis-trans isomerase n=1 Tax=Oceanobacter sp. 4_MG-2023 TaxID=3062623 RepID=UPI002735512C|nr:FKBP-type peptidyl-prolyl cis-trans isomerase [Oceanobacter sp. 4_MG-2023]MDP2546802.1 FKBP-type peptidyl-prolyl cis-trans isomerase [Oceanobacter sp. 4_MG-2023]
MLDILLVAVIAGLLGYALRRAGVGSKGADENIALGDAFLAKNGAEDGVVSTASGLQYKVLKPGNGGKHPAASSKVTVHYHGTLLNGTVFDSSVERGETISFRLNQVIPGWTEGVQLMTVGQKNIFYIPSELGYGKRRAGRIEPGSLLIFEVELLGIE